MHAGKLVFAQVMPVRPWIDDFSAGYMRRVIHRFPKQGDRDPWRNTQDYALEKKIIRKAPLADGVLCFSNAAPAGDETDRASPVAEEPTVAAM